jgi:hypothetical protein
MGPGQRGSGRAIDAQTEERQAVDDKRKGGQFPTLNSKILRDYLAPEDPASGRKASSDMFEHYGPTIETTVSERLRRRFGELAGEVVQEAWMRCLSELQARKNDFMKGRPERPSVGLLMASHTMRAVWTLEQRARRQQSRHTNVEQSGLEHGSERVADTDITPEDFHAIFEAAWDELLQVSSDAERDALQQAGPVLFFAGDWQSEPGSADTQAEIIRQRLDVAREILQRILSKRYSLKPDAIRRFLRWLLPPA